MPISAQEVILMRPKIILYIVKSIGTVKSARKVCRLAFKK